MFKINNQDTRTVSMALFWYLHSQLLTYFKPLSIVSTVDVDQVNVCWEGLAKSQSMIKLTVQYGQRDVWNSDL